MKRSIKFMGVCLVVAFAFAISACTLVEKDEEEKEQPARTNGNERHHKRVHTQRHENNPDHHRYQ